MKLHKFAALGCFLSLEAAALECQQPSTIDDLATLDSIRAGIDEFCSNTKSLNRVTLGTTTLQISDREGIGAPSLTECVAAFEGLVSSCLAKGFHQGTTVSGGVHYELVPSLDTSIHARSPAKKPKTPAKKPKAPAKKTTKKVTPPKASKTAAPKTSKAAPIKATPTKATSVKASSTRTSSAASASATGSSKCKNLGKNDKVGRNKSKRENGPRSPHAELLSRAPKKGQVCGITLESDSFTSSGKQPGNIATYGWTIADSCTDYRWGGWDATGDYETEHIMEWQMVTSFFKTLEEKWSSKLWNHPDPKAVDANNKRKQIGFCAYWKEQWISNGGQFSIGTSPAMTVQKHIAYEYPSDARYKNEFVVLQAKINSPAKQSLWQHDPNEPIYNDSEMQRLVDGSDEDIRIAVQRVRAVIGMYKYMTEPTIKKYFGEEVTRMGKQIGKIDTTLPSHPRRITRGDVRTYDPWQKMDLEREWSTYANAKFVQAKKKADEFGAKWVKKLKDKKCSAAEKKKAKADPKDTPAIKQKKAEMTDIQFTIDKLETEWKKIPNWTRPW